MPRGKWWRGFGHFVLCLQPREDISHGASPCDTKIVMHSEALYQMCGEPRATAEAFARWAWRLRICLQGTTKHLPIGRSHIDTAPFEPQILNLLHSQHRFNYPNLLCH